MATHFSSSNCRFCCGNNLTIKQTLLRYVIGILGSNNGIHKC